jgi:hypothetical protein
VARRLCWGLWTCLVLAVSLNAPLARATAPAAPAAAVSVAVTVGDQVPALCAVAYPPRVAVNVLGDEAAVWACNIGTAGLTDVEASYRAAGGAWGAAAVVSPSTNVPGDVRVGMAGDGTATVVWEEWNTANGGFDQILEAPLTRGGASAATVLSTNDHSARYPQLAVNGNGDAVVSWLESTGQPGFAIRATGGEFQAPLTIASFTDTGEIPVAINSVGDVSSAWAFGTGSLSVATYTAGAGFAVANVTIPGYAGRPSVGIDDSGRVSAGWSTYSRSGDTILNYLQSVQCAVHGTCGPVQDVSPSTDWQSDGSASVVYDSAGERVAVWYTGSNFGPNPDGFTVEAATAMGGQPFGPPMIVATTGNQNAPAPVASLDGAGNAFITWNHCAPANCDQPDIYGAEFPVTPPVAPARVAYSPAPFSTNLVTSPTSPTRGILARAGHQIDLASAGNGRVAGVWTPTVGVGLSSAADVTHLAPSLSGPTALTGRRGQTVNAQFSASGFPTPTLSETGLLPLGVRFTDHLDGTASVTGTPSLGGRFSITVLARNRTASVTRAFTLTVNSAPVITRQPVSRVTRVGTTVTFVATAAGPPTPAVRWQVSTNRGATWAAVRNATKTSYSVYAHSYYNGRRYRAVFTNSLGHATTRAAVLTVK